MFTARMSINRNQLDKLEKEFSEENVSSVTVYQATGCVKVYFHEENRPTAREVLMAEVTREKLHELVASLPKGPEAETCILCHANLI